MAINSSAEHIYNFLKLITQAFACLNRFLVPGNIEGRKMAVEQEDPAVKTALKLLSIATLSGGVRCFLINYEELFKICYVQKDNILACQGEGEVCKERLFRQG